MRPKNKDRLINLSCLATNVRKYTVTTNQGVRTPMWPILQGLAGFYWRFLIFIVCALAHGRGPEISIVLYADLVIRK